MIHVALVGRMAVGFGPELARRIRHPYSITAIPDLSKLDRFATELSEAHVLVGWPVNNALVARAPQVRLVQASGIGVDGLDLAALPPDVRVANTHHHEAAIAEYIMMAMLWLARHPQRYDALMRNGDWEGSCVWGEAPAVRELRGGTAMLLGLGYIAHEVALRARAFGMRLIGVTRRLGEPDAAFDEVISWRGWESRLPEVAYLIPCCPLTPETEGLIGERVYGLLPSSACVINVTRGRVLDEQATYDALRTRRIAGAALDVWYRYPSRPGEVCLPSRFPFHELPNVLLSPHNSAWTQATIGGRLDDISENINRLAEDRELLNRLR
jgi:phosphoglycerate dehydrogenase-like enzyme